MADRINPAEIVDTFPLSAREALLLGAVVLAGIYARSKRAEGISLAELWIEKSAKIFDSAEAYEAALKEIGLAAEFLVDDILVNPLRNSAFEHLTDDDIDMVVHESESGLRWLETKANFSKPTLFSDLPLENFVFEIGSEVLTSLPDRFGLSLYKGLSPEDRRQVLRHIVVTAYKSGTPLISGAFDK